MLKYNNVELNISSSNYKKYYKKYGQEVNFHLVEEVDAINNGGGCAFLVYASYNEVIDQIKHKIK